MLSEAMNWLRYINNAVFCDLKKLQETSAEQELVKSVSLKACKSFCNVRCWKELERREHVVFGANNLVDFFNLFKKLIKASRHGHAFCSALPFFKY